MYPIYFPRINFRADEPIFLERNTELHTAGSPRWDGVRGQGQEQDETRDVPTQLHPHLLHLLPVRGPH